MERFIVEERGAIETHAQTLIAEEMSLREQGGASGHGSASRRHRAPVGRVAESLGGSAGSAPKRRTQ